VPGRRKATPPSRPSRLGWGDGPREHPARARRPSPRSASGSSSTAETLVVETPAPQSSTVPQGARWSPRLLGVAWLLLLAAGAGGLVALRELDAGDLPRQAVAGAVGVLLAVGVAVRSGGRAVIAALLALALAAAAVATGWEPLLAGAAVGTGVLAAGLAVLGTVPAPSFLRVVREVVLALVLASVGALAVDGFAVPVDPDRFGYTVLALGLVATVAMVYRLGGGLHGLGRRGVAVGVAAVVLLAVALAYTEALAQWGSPGMTDSVDAVTASVRRALGASPHPIEVLVGIPALAWGVSMRARRRQGWWVCAFGATATASVTSRLLTADLAATSTALSVAYGLVLGLALGWVVIRVEQALQPGRGRRARRDDDVVRTEPGRLRPLH
jgi:hypothetical protein